MDKTRENCITTGKCTHFCFTWTALSYEYQDEGNRTRAYIKTIYFISLSQRNKHCVTIGGVGNFLY